MKNAFETAICFLLVNLIWLKVGFSQWSEVSFNFETFFKFKTQLPTSLLGFEISGRHYFIDMELNRYGIQDSFDFFANETLWEDIEIVSTQKTNLKDAIDRWREKRLDVFEKVKLNNMLVSEAYDAMWKIEHEMREEISRDVLDHQFEALRQTQFRMLISRRLSDVYTSNELANALGIELGKLAPLVINNKRKVIQSFNKNCEELKGDILEGLAAGLDNNARERFFERWRDFDQLPVFLIDLQLDFQNQFLLDDQKTPVVMSQLPQFAITPAGEIKRWERKQNSSAVERRQRELLEFRTVATSEELQEELKMEQGRSDKIKELYAKYENELTTLRKRRREPKSEETFVFEEAVQVLNDTYAEEFHRQFTNSELNLIDRFIKSKLVSILGPLADLVTNSADYSIENSRANRNAEQCRETLKKRCVEIEADVFEGLFDGISEECRKNLDALIGKEVYGVVPRIDFWRQSMQGNR